MTKLPTEIANNVTEMPAKIPRKPGRPRSNVDPSQVIKLARSGCTVREVASLVGCSEDTIHKRFSAEMTKGRETMKMRLRRKQLVMALRGNVSMLIWLGKQYLGQTDKQVVTLPTIDYASLSDAELEALAAAESIG